MQEPPSRIRVDQVARCIFQRFNVSIEAIKSSLKPAGFGGGWQRMDSSSSWLNCDVVNAPDGEPTLAHLGYVIKGSGASAIRMMTTSIDGSARPVMFNPQIMIPGVAIPDTVAISAKGARVRDLIDMDSLDDEIASSIVYSIQQHINPGQTEPCLYVSIEPEWEWQ